MAREYRPGAPLCATPALRLGPQFERNGRSRMGNGQNRMEITAPRAAAARAGPVPRSRASAWSLSRPIARSRSARRSRRRSPARRVWRCLRRAYARAAVFARADRVRRRRVRALRLSAQRWHRFLAIARAMDRRFPVQLPRRRDRADALCLGVRRWRSHRRLRALRLIEAFGLIATPFLFNLLILLGGRLAHGGYRRRRHARTRAFRFRRRSSIGRR